MSKTETSGLAKMFGVLVVGTVIFIGYGYISASGDRDVKPQRPSVDEDVTETIITSVTSNPVQRPGNPAHIEVRVEGVRIAEEFMSRSPYNSTFKIPKGAEVTLTATQQHAGTLDCVLQSNNRVSDSRSLGNPGVLLCVHNPRKRG